MRLILPSHATIPVRANLVLRGGGRARLGLAVRYGILLRESAGPVLIDAGWPEARDGDSHALRLYRHALGARVDPEAHPLCVLSRLGHAPGDLSAVILTHLHADHLGALRDLPGVPVHAHREALKRMRAHGWRALRHGTFTELLPDDLPSRTADLEGGDVALPFGLGQGRDVLGDGSVLSVDLPGHADGHTGLLLPRFDPPVLFAADVQWVLDALPDRLPRGPARLVYADPARAAGSAARVEAFRRAGGRVILSHDPAPVPDLVA